ncbi:MAG: SbcC/MukB-like Walker B domain-containing protein [Lacrimispora sp.]
MKRPWKRPVPFITNTKYRPRDGNRIETGRWKEEAAALREEQKRLQNERARLTGLYSRASHAEENLKRQWKEREVLEEEYSLYHNLFQTANGKMAGSVSLDFQTYVQRQYFSQMIQAANQRLKVMTDGQFLLQCRDLDALGKQGEVGLDLDVYTMATDRLRDIKTLSGGESFMAALAMALGMADIIQRTAGNVSMDALFIDEGFGSLDEESRLKAVRILQELAGGRRLVGIISHVTELKEQIGKKLAVKKTEKGSRIQWELENP